MLAVAFGSTGFRNTRIVTENGAISQTHGMVPRMVMGPRYSRFY
jgi:hypothetical protein